MRWKNREKSNRQSRGELRWQKKEKSNRQNRGKIPG